MEKQQFQLLNDCLFCVSDLDFNMLGLAKVFRELLFSPLTFDPKHKSSILLAHESEIVWVS